MSSADILTGSRFGKPKRELLSNLQILIVDDFADMRMTIRRMLRELGEEHVDFAANGKNALDKMQRNSFDIVLCDYNLGDGKDGHQILEEAHHLGIIKPSCIFILITAETSVPMVLGAVECQPDDYIAKPFTKEVLQLRLKKVVERKQELIDIYEALREKKYKDAITCAEARLKTKSRYVFDIARILGELYLKIGDYETAEKFYQKLLGQKNFSWAKFGLGQAQYYLGEYAVASNIFNELIADNHYYTEAYDWVAKCSLMLGDKKEAQEMLKEAARLSPKKISRQCQLGEIARENGDLDTAGIAYRSAIRHGAHSCFKSSKEYLGSSEVLIEQGETLKAMANLKEARQQFADQPVDLLQVLTVTATSYKEQDKESEAADFLNQAEKLYQAHAGSVSAEASVRLAEAAFKLENVDLGSAVISSLAANNHDDDAMLEKLRGIITEAGHSEALSGLLEESIKELQSLNKEGIRLAESGKLKESLELFEKATEKAPSNKAFNLNMTLACIMLMKENGVDARLMYKARQCLERVEEAGKKDKRHAELAQMLEALNAKNNKNSD